MIAAGIEYDMAGTGPQVLCLHGIGGGIDSFRPQMDAAVANPGSGSVSRNETRAGTRDKSGIARRDSPSPALEGFQILAWNMPGYGASTAEVWPPGFAYLSAALGDFIASIGHETVHLVGQSLGGMLALEHALRRPEQVSSMVLIGTTPSFGGRDNSFGDAFLKARLAPLDAGLGMAGMAKAETPGLVGPAASPEAIRSIETLLAAVTEETWRGILRCLVTFNRRNDLERVAQPCCLIAGSHDWNAPARTMKWMAEKLPCAELHVIENAGHMINQEDPEQTNAIIGRFLRKG